MTDGYDCYQNALAERVNGILKQEFLIEKCNTGKELDLLIKESIDTYNNKRPHLSLKMKTPNFIHEKTEEDNLFGQGGSGFPGLQVRHDHPLSCERLGIYIEPHLPPNHTYIIS